ncbi:30S ribosomal protein S13P [Halococcus morrhuae DSM 1307]|uniref:Small ribosomal subunit protein uS13 n=2 Tax=Halococcus TaxID=2249 RepID=M0M3K8_HALMO|nr:MULTISPECIES: 30S ribosomal protein S13 [Halococcus]EMA40291.1 30S ribosomal protein S13P [Halococcus morrhuae DSM 1307]UOO94718.1 30S ribosomal protein S13 [Halococcus dombrowskii]
MSAEDPDTQAEDEEEEDIRYFVRIGQTDLDGTKSVERALTGMNGVGRRTARIIAEQAEIDRTATLGRLDDDDVESIVEHVEGFASDVPAWLTNRPNDYFTGESSHEVGNDLSLTRQQDINRMQMISSYKGVRHERGQKVRGQRTKSTGRSEGTIGVNVEALQEEMEEEAEGE